MVHLVFFKGKEVEPYNSHRRGLRSSRLNENAPDARGLSLMLARCEQV